MEPKKAEKTLGCPSRVEGRERQRKESETERRSEILGRRHRDTNRGRDKLIRLTEKKNRNRQTHRQR